MNFEELYAPYATKEAPVYLDMIPWLKKNGIAPHIVDQAILQVFTDLQQGKTFEASTDHTATWHLWMYAREIADGLAREELQVYVRHLEGFHEKLKKEIDAEWEQMGKLKKIWAVISGKA
jgi:hypothetical protein